MRSEVSCHGRSDDIVRSVDAHVMKENVSHTTTGNSLFKSAKCSYPPTRIPMHPSMTSNKNGLSFSE
jgi:hypothetical protein